MHTHHIVTRLLLIFIFTTPSYAVKLRVERGSDLQGVLDFAKDGDTLLLGAKTFEAKPAPYTDPLCGNCLEAQTPVKASVGFSIKGKGLTIIGADRARTRLVTGAGYGVYIENSFGTSIQNLTITGGERDPDGNATDGGVVVRNSDVLLRDVDISLNNHRLDSVVVGIGGVMVREGAELIIDHCHIESNGWDGIALYRGGSAIITDCVIKDGRGAGIGATWDATCVAFRNEVTGYWKGIGAFGTSSVIAHNNLVHDNLGWGMVATGQSAMEIKNNVVHHNGNCGVAPWSTEARGRIINNIITENGWREQWVCPCVGVWNYGDWAKWLFANNIVWGNKAGEYEGIWDQSEINGNLNVDPKFVGSGDYHLQQDSPAWHAGDSTIFNIDGTKSNIGLYGGPQEWRR